MGKIDPWRGRRRAPRESPLSEPRRPPTASLTPAPPPGPREADGERGLAPSIAESVEELYARCGPAAYRVAYAVLRDGPRAEDVAAHAFDVVVRQARDANEVRGSTRLLLDATRREARRRATAQTIGGDTDRTVPAHAPFDALPREEAAVLFLASRCGMTVSEIAAERSVTRPEVHRLLTSALRRLAPPERGAPRAQCG